MGHVISFTSIWSIAKVLKKNDGKKKTDDPEVGHWQIDP